MARSERPKWGGLEGQTYLERLSPRSRGQLKALSGVGSLPSAGEAPPHRSAPTACTAIAKRLRQVLPVPRPTDGYDSPGGSGWARTTPSTTSGRPPAAPIQSAAAAAEAARLRVQSRSLGTENVRLQQAVKDLQGKVRVLEARLGAQAHQAERRESSGRLRRAETEAEAEAAARRQQAALEDLAGSARQLAEENRRLASLLECQTDQAADASRAKSQLGQRLSRLQKLYLQAGGNQATGAAAAVPGDGSLAGQLLACLPAGSPAKSLDAGRVRVAAAGLPTDLRQALRALEALRREREVLAARVKSLEGRGETARREQEEAKQARAAERQASAAAATQLQRQLKHATARVGRLVSAAGDALLLAAAAGHRLADPCLVVLPSGFTAGATPPYRPAS